MKKKWKISIVIVCILALFGFLALNYVMHGGARDIQSEQSEFKVNSKEFIAEFTKNSDKATKKYLNKTIEISGKITNIKDSVVTIDTIVLCRMISLDKVKTSTNNAKLKGRVVGFDDLLGEIQIDQCTIKNNI